MRVGVTAGPRDRLAVGLGRVFPRGGDAVVVESRLAVHHQLDRAAHASHRAQQDVLGVPIHRRAAMRPRPRVDVVPRSHHQRIAHDHPAGVGLPGGLQDQAAGQVATRSRHRNAIRAQPEVARAAVQDRAEDAGGVGARHTQPFHRAGRARSGRCSRSPTGTRSRRSAERGSATTRSEVYGTGAVTVNGASLGLARPLYGPAGAPSEGSVCCRTMRTSSTAERPGVHSSARVRRAVPLSAGQTPAHVRAADRSRRHIRPRCAARAPCWRSAPEGKVWRADLPKRRPR